MDAFYDFTLMAFAIFFVITSIGAFSVGDWSMAIYCLVVALGLLLVRKL